MGSSRSVAYLRRPGGWWSLPARLAGTVRRRRALVPAPVVYLLAVVAGAVLGVVAQALAGWPWWLVAAGVVAAVWLLFLSSAFWRPGADRPLATELLFEVDPVRGMRRERQAMVERFRAAPFPLYGLPASWPGPRHLAGWGSRGTRGGSPVVTNLCLGHGDPLSERGPQLRVEVWADDPDTAELRRTLAEGESDLPWSPVTIRVDGRPVGFDLLAEGRHWVALGELEGRALVLEARDLAVEELELVRVADLEPYVEGAVRMDDTVDRHTGPRGRSP